MSVTLTQDQSHIIAAAILPDIKDYLQKHRTEFEAWLKNYEEAQKPPERIGA